MVNVELGHEHYLADQFRELEDVTEVNQTFGSHDMIVEVEGDSVDKCRDTIKYKIRGNPHVRSTMTLVAINHAVKVGGS
jgi:DNA-binding Lrp family transcriptional regulator